MIKRALYICAHPDDCELMFGGTISHFVKESIDVKVIIVSDGTKWVCDNEMQYEDIKARRKEEALDSGKLLGIKEVCFLDYVDGTLEKKEVLISLLKSIRKYNPNIIFTHSEEEKHSDHIEVSRAVKRLCNQLSEPAPILNDFWVDEYMPVMEFYSLYTYATITEINSDSTIFIPLKIEDINNKINAVLCHKSQFDVESQKRLSDRILTEAKFLGNLCGNEYAETCKKIKSTHYNVETIV